MKIGEVRVTLLQALIKILPVFSVFFVRFGSVKNSTRTVVCDRKFSAYRRWEGRPFRLDINEIIFMCVS